MERSSSLLRRVALKTTVIYKTLKWRSENSLNIKSLGKNLFAKLLFLPDPLY